MSFTWNGINCENYGVRVEHYPEIPIPVRRQSLLQIPGRNGGILITESTFDNVILNYDVYISESANTAVSTRDILAWLLVPGYKELTDTYDVGITRMAFFDTDEHIQSILNRFGRVTLTFNAKPQRFLTSGLGSTTYSTATTLTNPTTNTARPLIVCHGDGAGTLTVGNDTITLATSEITLDSESQQAYHELTNLNDQVTGDFPILPSGDTGISFSGGITSVDITPRWFYL